MMVHVEMANNANNQTHHDGHAKFEDYAIKLFFIYPLITRLTFDLVTSIPIGFIS